MYSLKDHEPYRQAMEKVEDLQAKLKDLSGEGKAAAAAELENLALNLEAEALLDGKLQNKARAARKKAEDATQAEAQRQREKQTIGKALEQIGPALERYRDEAKGKVIQQARADHEKTVKKLVASLREVSEAAKGEQEVYRAAIKAVGITSRLANLTGLPFIDPGQESDPHSKISHTLAGLRRLEYDV